MSVALFGAKKKERAGDHRVLSEVEPHQSARPGLLNGLGVGEAATRNFHAGTGEHLVVSVHHHSIPQTGHLFIPPVQVLEITLFGTSQL